MEETAGCVWDAALFFIFSENVGPLVYYSHLLPLIASLIVGIFALFASKRTLIHWVLFFITLMFSTWVYFDLILWASPSPEAVMFFWSSIVPIELLIYASCLYLVYLFCNDLKDIPLRTKIAIGLFFVPIILFNHTEYNVLGLSPDCDEGAIEGALIQYMYIVEIIFILWAAIIAIRTYLRTSDPAKRMQLLVISVGTIAFLLSFTAGNLTLIFSVGPWYEQYKLFGMPIFAAFITYSAIRFNTFNVKVFTAQALVVASAVLIFSLLFIRTIQNIQIVTAITFVLVCLVGYILIRNVRKEIEQRELIEKQEKELEVINKEQENLLHFISHEVKGYLTKSEAGFAAITEESFGPISAELKKMSGMALTEMRKGVATVMDILNASDLKKGTVSYAKKQFDFKAAVQSIVEDLKPSADEKQLKIKLSIDEGRYIMVGDEHKIRLHAIRNLIDNAIKYTPAGGSIEVKLSDGAKIRFSVKDNGVGITKDDMQRLFTEGGHGKDSLKINVHSTGYGLYIAKKIVEAHGGKIWAESEGGGKGSRFIVELPVSS